MFSVDGKYIITGGDETGYLWNRATGQQLRTFGNVGTMWTVAIAPDSQSVIVGGSEQIAQLWDVDYQGLADSVCTRVLRDFTDEEREKYSIYDQEPTCSTK